MNTLNTLDTLAADRGSQSRLAVVDFVAYVVLVFSLGLAVALALGAVVLLLAGDAQADAQAMKPGEVQQGTLLFKKEGEVSERGAARRQPITLRGAQA
jgi:hypothetical protein